MKQMLFAAALAGGLLALPAGGQAQLVSKRTLSLEGAKSIAGVIATEAKRLNVGGAIAVVDDGGNLLYLERLDGTFAAAAGVATGKARTAALFRKPTGFFEEVVNVKGRTTMVALDDFTPLAGGEPILVGGQVVGAVGVSGAASAAQDEEFAKLAAGMGAALLDGAEKVTFLDSGAVSQAFARGAPLVEVPEYKVHASRREAPGQVEVHESETDIVYVLEGKATFVTGGSVVDGKPISPGEIRGASIQGGESRSLVKGDIVIVPRGTPHWFQSVEGPLLYYVVKVI